MPLVRDQAAAFTGVGSGLAEVLTDTHKFEAKLLDYYTSCKCFFFAPVGVTLSNLKHPPPWFVAHDHPPHLISIQYCEYVFQKAKFINTGFIKPGRGIMIAEIIFCKLPFSIHRVIVYVVKFLPCRFNAVNFYAQ